MVVAGAEPKRDALAAASRYAVAYHRIPNPWHAARPFETALRALVAEHACEAIVTCSDVTMARLEGLDVGAPTLPVLDDALHRVTDKVTLAEVCAEAGVMYPRTVSADDGDQSSNEMPLIVKPRRTAVPTPHRVLSRTGAFVVHTADELDAAVSELREIGLEVIVQRRVQRAFKVNVSFVRRSGLTSFHIAYRVLREHPAQGGLAATIETLDPLSGVGARALEAAQRVCDTAGYVGLANVEFYGQDDGELCLIEVNARVWGSIDFPEQLGLRPTERAVRDVLGEPPEPPVAYVAGRRFHRLTLEVKALLAPSPERGSRLRLLRSVRPWDVFDALSISDPLPVARAAGQIVGRGLRVVGGSAIPRRR